MKKKMSYTHWKKQAKNIHLQKECLLFEESLFDASFLPSILHPVPIKKTITFYNFKNIFLSYKLSKNFIKHLCKNDYKFNI